MLNWDFARALPRILHGSHQHTANTKWISEPERIPLIHIILVTLILVFTSLIGVWLAFAIKKFKQHRWSQISNCFAGGALLALCIGDMLPHYTDNALVHQTSPFKRFLIVYVLHIIGFSTMLIMETIIGHSK